ncbi:ATP-binding protein [Romboutsia lituseburensis]|uniref:sensor histidine kinase n=1 Tax=Romboutsia lituseburensis TaxID=1537 RepID=UPI00215B1712|nr:ATP-binding protein [Romboutsia lituseburensis]MCR8747066.1 ATP-binding protein [Romboutsia lituseburensis]
MNASVFVDILEDSPLAYFSLRVIKNKNGKCIDAKLLDGNKAFDLLLEGKLDKIKGKLLSEIMISEDFHKITFTHFFELNDKNKNTSIAYSSDLNRYLNCEIYPAGEDLFILRLTEVSYNNINFSTILRDSPFIVWIKDRDGRYIDVNKKFTKKCKKSYKEIIGRYDYDIWIQAYSYAYKKQDNEVMKSRKICYYQEAITSVLDDDFEKHKIYDITKWPYVDPEGNVLGTVGIAIEIIDKVELRENLKQNEANFTEITKYSEEVFIISDKYKCLYISPAFNKVFEQNPDKLYKDITYLSEYFHPDDISTSHSNVNLDDNVEFIKRIKTKSSCDKWIWGKSFPIRDERGNTIKNIFIISDITKKKNQQDELENLKVDFFANISHELRTPLNVIFSTLQFLKLKSNDFTNNKLDFVNKYLNIIEQNGYRLLKLVNNLIDSTKIDAGYLQYSPQNFNIINFVEDICMSVSDFICQHNMTLVFDTDTEEKIIGFDLDMMERIILNLLSNAIKFNSQDGKIEVYITCDEHVNISIKDNGIGIESDKLNSIFGRFEQVNNKKVHKREGSGIGLSLVKSLVDMHNGKITASSEINNGTTFTVSIPINTVDAPIISTNISVNSDNKVNRMNVEFSDIYF